MKKYKNTIIVLSIISIVVSVYLYFRSKAQQKGFSNSKFYASLFAVPYQDINQEVFTAEDFTVDEADDINAEFDDIINGGVW
jgi:uncharacterized membrane protein